MFTDWKKFGILYIIINCKYTWNVNENIKQEFFPLLRFSMTLKMWGQMFVCIILVFKVLLF